MSLYEDLNLLPRWPGFEEDEDLAGPADEKVVDPNQPSTETPLETKGSKENEKRGKNPSVHRNGFANGNTQSYTQEELEGMGLRVLGKLRAKGVDVSDIIRRKRRKGKRGDVVSGDFEVDVEVGDDAEEVQDGAES